MPRLGSNDAASIGKVARLCCFDRPLQVWGLPNHVFRANVKRLSILVVYLLNRHFFCLRRSPLTPARGRGFDCGLKVV